RTAVPFELGAKLRVVAGERGPDVLGVESLRARRRADEVGEEDRHDLPLLARGLGDRREGGPAHAAEAEALRVLLAAGRTRDHARTVNLLLESVEDGARHLAQPHVALERLEPAGIGLGGRTQP